MPLKASPTCKFEGCNAPRHVYPGGFLCQYCDVHMKHRKTKCRDGQPSMNNYRKLTAGSLFSGMGGIDLAFTAAGFDILWQVEINHFCQKVLAKHWPNASRFEDVRTVGKHNLSYVDVLFGGAPCQPFSIAGKQEGEKDERFLIPEMLRIVDEIKPMVFLFENVPNIRNVADGAAFIRILRQLAEIGYDAEWDCLRASDFGAPHIRERIFIVAYASSFRQPESRTEQNACSDEEWNVSPSERRGRTEPDAIVSGGQNVEYTAIQGLEEPGRAGQWQGTAQKGAGVDSGVEQSGSHVVNASSPGRQEFDLPRVACDAGHASGRYDAEQSRRLHESRVGTDPDGLSARLVGHRFPAGQGTFQYDYEPPRTVAEKVAWHKDKIEAVGNAVAPQCVYPVALAIREWLDVDAARLIHAGEVRP